MRTVDSDRLAADRVQVGVGPSAREGIEQARGDGNNSVRIGVEDTTRAKTCRVESTCIKV